LPPRVIHRQITLTPPLNTGTATQTKSGVLNLADATTNNLAVFGGIGIATAQPSIKFVDTNAGSVISRILYSVNKMYFQADRDGDGVYDNVSPLVVAFGASSTNDYAVFGGQVRASEYCDRNGQNCLGSAGTQSASLNWQVGSVVLPARSSYQSSTGGTTNLIQAIYFDKPFSVPPKVVVSGCGKNATIYKSGFLVSANSADTSNLCGLGDDFTAVGSAADTDFTVGDPGWYSNLSRFDTCTLACSARGLTSATDPATGGTCLSGTRRLSTSDDAKYGIEYIYGIFGSSTPANTVVTKKMTSSGGSNDQLCILSSQSAYTQGGNDDLLVGCYCQ